MSLLLLLFHSQRQCFQRPTHRVVDSDSFLLVEVVKLLCALTGRLSVDSSEGDMEVGGTRVFLNGCGCLWVFLCTWWFHSSRPPRPPFLLLLTRRMKVPTPPPYPPSGPPYIDVRAPTHKPCLNWWERHMHVQSLSDKCQRKYKLKVQTDTE